MYKGKNIFPYLLLIGGALITFAAFLYASGYKIKLRGNESDVAGVDTESNQEVKAEEVNTEEQESQDEVEESVPAKPSFTATISTQTEQKEANGWIIKATVNANDAIKTCSFELGYPGMITYKEGVITGGVCTAESNPQTFENLRAWVRVTSFSGKVAEAGKHPWQ